jgi:predicted amidophosphoribosyltransferase
MPVMRALREFAHNLAKWVYPNACLICDAAEGDAGTFRHGVCNDCHAAVTNDPLPACPWCAQSVGPHTNTTDGCPECRGTAHAFERAFRLGSYAGKLRDAVLRMKFLAGEGLADLAGRIFA